MVPPERADHLEEKTGRYAVMLEGAVAAARPAPDPASPARAAAEAVLRVAGCCSPRMVFTPHAEAAAVDAHSNGRRADVIELERAIVLLAHDSVAIPSRKAEQCTAGPCTAFLRAWPALREEPVGHHGGEDHCQIEAG